MIRISPRKLNLVAQSIRGKKAETALNELTFSPKRIAKAVKKVLQSAIANAENNHDLDVDDLVVERSQRRQESGDEALPCARPRPRRGGIEKLLQPDHHRGRGEARREKPKKPSRSADGEEAERRRSCRQDVRQEAGCKEAAPRRKEKA